VYSLINILNLSANYSDNQNKSPKAQVPSPQSPVPSPQSNPMKAQKTWSTPVLEEEKELIPCALCGGLEFEPYLQCTGYAFVRCPNCGLVQINPQSGQNLVIKRYSGKAYLNYELENETNFFTLGKLALNDAGLDGLEEELARRGGSAPKLLEIGCATGALLEFLRDRGWDVCGVEISGEEADYARAKRGLEIHSIPLEEVKFPDNYFDLVVASHLIEHLNNPRSFVREVHRILKPQGRFFVTTPNIAGFQAKLFGNLWRSAIFDHLYLFSKKTLSKLLLEEGFELEKFVSWGGLAAGSAPFLLKRIADKLAKKFGFGDVMLIRAVKGKRQ